MSRSRALLALRLTVLMMAVGCGSDSSSPSTTPDPLSGGTSRASGSLRVFAAASLTESFGDEQVRLKAGHPELSITFSFAGSGALATQVQQGAPADVVATADPASMRRLTDAGLVEPSVIFAKNELQVLVAPGNPKGIMTLADLARPDLKVVLGDASVPFGRYGAESLEKASVTVKPVSKELDVKAAVSKVTSGEADATIVYVTDVRAAGAKGRGVEIPEAQNVLAEYPIAIVKATTNRPAAAVFVDAIVNGSGQAVLRRRGFLPPG